MSAEKLGPYILGPNDTPENGIYTGDARELAQAIPDESVDLIFTDPVYDRIDDYRWLAETAARVLRQDRACLAWYGPRQLRSVLLAMTALEFFHLVSCYMPSCFALRSPIKNMWMTWRGLLIFGKGDLETNGYSRDYCDFIVDKKRPNLWQPENHHWTKNPDVIAYYTQAFLDDGFVFDPFTGGGTVPAVCKMLGRRYLAFEIDPDTAEMARQRVRQTQPPLFVPQPQQKEMALEE
jgi:hypothetical protein